MRVLPWADGWSGGAEPVEEPAGRTLSLGGGWLSLSGAELAGGRR